VKFMCCKIVKRLTVILSGKYSNKSSVKFRTHKLFVTLPGNTRQYDYCSYKSFRRYKKQSPSSITILIMKMTFQPLVTTSTRQTNIIKEVFYICYYYNVTEGAYDNCEY
jgi:hypothetical protein